MSCGKGNAFVFLNPPYITPAVLTCSSALPLLSPSFLLGYELLYQPEVVRIYTSLLKESKNPTVLEASAGAVQNLCAGRWTVRAAIRHSLIAIHSRDSPCSE